jgi:hypothetical protein
MKIHEYFGRLHNIRWSVFLRTATPLPLVLALFVIITACDTLRNDQPKNALTTQVYSDMMYGADDYFGQSTDLSYSDGVVPTVPQPVVVATVVAPVSSTRRTSSTQAASPAPAPPPVAVAPVVVTPVVVPATGG